MAIEITSHDDPAFVRQTAGEFLCSKPVLHNMVLTLLEERIARPENGRYWIAREDSAVVGVAVQTPVTELAILTPMPQSAAEALAGAVSDAGHALPGAFGEVAAAAQFAARWALRNARGVEPVEGILLCEVEQVRPRTSVTGSLRQATIANHDLVVDWLARFYAEIGQPQLHAQEPFAARLQAGLYWLWLDPEPVSMAGISQVVAGVARVRAAYTPTEFRNRGYCAACVGALSQRVLDQGHRCILYTDLANPASNASYRRIGYEPRGVEMRFRFLDAAHGQ